MKHFVIAIREVAEPDEGRPNPIREFIHDVAKDKTLDVVKFSESKEGGTSLIATVTPEIAAEWILRNVNGIAMRPATVASLVETMKAGKWELKDGHDVTFDTFGDLIGGQHRVQAVIDSGCTVQMRVTIGMPVKTLHAAKPRPEWAARDWNPPADKEPSATE
jgi:hypothetical protein